MAERVERRGQRVFTRKIKPWRKVYKRSQRRSPAAPRIKLNVLDPSQHIGVFEVVHNPQPVASYRCCGIFKKLAKLFKTKNEAKSLTSMPLAFKQTLFKFLDPMTAMCLGLTCREFFIQNLALNGMKSVKVDDFANGLRFYELLSTYMAPRIYNRDVNAFITQEAYARLMKQQTRNNDMRHENVARLMQGWKPIGKRILAFFGWDKLQRQIAIHQLRKLLKKQEKEERKRAEEERARAQGKDCGP